MTQQDASLSSRMVRPAPPARNYRRPGGSLPHPSTTSPMPASTQASRFERLRRAIAAQMPGRAELAQVPLLRPIAHRLAARELWQFRPEGLARGAALGVFWAFVLPVAQILVAAAHCVWWRGHIPVAAAVTLITNPLTIGPWLLAAHQIGSLFIDAPPPVAAASGWLAQLQSLGAPTLLGMAILAVGGSILTYLAVRAAAQIRLAWRLRRRARRGARA